MIPSRTSLRSAAWPVILIALSVAAAGCALSRQAVTTSGAGPVKPSAPGTPATPPPAAGKTELPGEFTVGIALREGQSWKSRFVSTGEVKRTLTVAGGEPAVRSRAMGLELTATQRVVGVSGDTATIEVAETDVKILQEGKFVAAPFRPLNPPATFRFTIDVRTGATDFSAMEKAYADWMAGIKEGPAGEIFGKTFRADAYARQLKELYAKPFTRFTGKKIGKETRSVQAKDFILPFVGPGAAIPPIPVSVSLWSEGIDVGTGSHHLRAAQSYESGPVERKEAESAAPGFSDFGMAVPASFRGTAEARGQLRSTLDLLSGRELQSYGQVTYKATTTFEKGTLTEEIAGKLLLEPAE